MRIDPAALPFAAILLAAAVASTFVHLALAAAFGVLLLFTLWFFRDPHRTPPSDRDALLAPADGRIIVAGPALVSVFMNVFNVHVCRAPAAGAIEAVEHAPGRFRAAWRDDASEHNERTTIRLSGERGALRFVLVAGLVARRIVCRVGAGGRVEAGERVGLIRFGSRVDVEVPPGVEVAVTVGQRVVAGETVIGRWARNAPDGAGGEDGAGAAAPLA